MPPFFPIDVARYLAAVALFWLVIVPPGFVLAWLFNLLGFRNKSALFQLYAATALGLSLTPILMYLCWSLGSLICVWLLYGMFWTAFVALLVLRRVPVASLRPPRIELVVALGWIALCALIVLDLRIGDGVYINWASGDHSFRTSVINAISHTNVLPPSNPFFHPGRSIPFRYHYFWFMVAAFVDVLSRGFVGARDALFASIAWSGLALAATTFLFLFRDDDEQVGAWRKRTWIASVLMAITGLDLLPFGFAILKLSLQQHHLFLPSGDFESWNHDGQVTSWLGSFIWVPNHVGALVCGFTGALLLLWAYNSGKRSSFIIGSLAAGLAFASCAGCSIFVVFVFAVALAALFAVSLVRRDKCVLTILALTGGIAMIAALPYLRELKAEQRGVPFAVLRPRSFGPVLDLIQETPETLDAKGNALMLLSLPLNYALELGFFAAIAINKFRKIRRSEVGETDKLLMLLLVSGVLVGSFLASVALNHNDLGWRAMLVVQFVLLLWAVDWVQNEFLLAWRARDYRKWLAVTTIALLGVVGLLGTVCDGLLLRLNAVAIQHGYAQDPNPVLALDLGPRTGELREIYTKTLKILPLGRLVQEEPMVRDAIQQGLYSAWPAVARGRWYGPSYGGDPALYYQTEATIFPVFGQPVTVAEVAKLCRRADIGAYVVQDFDPVWQHQDSWIWSVPAIYAGQHARAYTCSKITQSVPTAY